MDITSFSAFGYLDKNKSRESKLRGVYRLLFYFLDSKTFVMKRFLYGLFWVVGLLIMLMGLMIEIGHFVGRPVGLNGFQWIINGMVFIAFSEVFFAN